MNPLLAGLMSGASSLIGNIFSANTSAQNTQAQIQAQQGMLQETEQFNAGQVQQQEQFQQQMSSTAYQRASADMQKAGLNPMMMFGSGGAASSPSGGAASVGTPSVPMPQTRSPVAGIGEAITTGLTAAVTGKSMDKMADEMANLITQNKLMQAATEKTQAEADVTRQRVLPSMVAARQASAIDEFARAHPDMFYGSEVAKYLGNTASSVIDPVAQFATTGSGVARLLMNPTAPTKKYTGLGPSGTQSVKDMIDDAMGDLKGKTLQPDRSGLGSYSFQ